MEHAEFQIDQEFWCSDRLWRCTDVGQRVIVAIRIDEVTACRMDAKTRIKTERTMTGAELKSPKPYTPPNYFPVDCVYDELRTSMRPT